MKILIDADGCPVRKIVVKIAKAEDIPLVIVSNYNHEINEEYGEIISVDASFDHADHVIVSKTLPGDLVITQDYGLASLVLSKKGFAMHQDGWLYTEDNIEALLMRRYLGRKIRKETKRFSYIPKRKKHQDENFHKGLSDFIKKYRGVSHD